MFEAFARQASACTLPFAARTARDNGREAFLDKRSGTPAGRALSLHPFTEAGDRRIDHAF
jgi:hypothetical protein